MTDKEKRTDVAQQTIDDVALQTIDDERAMTGAPLDSEQADALAGRLQGGVKQGHGSGGGSIGNRWSVDSTLRRG